jgi:hypothetical protein
MFFLRRQAPVSRAPDSGLAYDPRLLEKSSTPTMLARMLRNLLSIYEQESEEPMARRVRAFLELIEN